MELASKSSHHDDLNLNQGKISHSTYGQRNLYEDQRAADENALHSWGPYKVKH